MLENDAIRIGIPLGRYVPEFSPNVVPPAPAPPHSRSWPWIAICGAAIGLAVGIGSLVIIR